MTHHIWSVFGVTVSARERVTLGHLDASALALLNREDPAEAFWHLVYVEREQEMSRKDDPPAEEPNTSSASSRESHDTNHRPTVNSMTPGPIGTEEELDRAIAIVNRLAVRRDLTREEDAYLEELSDRIVAYEDTHYPFSEE